MNAGLMDVLQAVVALLAILLTLAILLDLRGRPGVPSKEIEQLFRTTIELLTLVLYRISERAISRRLSYRDAKQDEPTEKEDVQRDKLP